MSSCPCYRSKFQFDESLTVEHLLINIHSHNSGIILALKLEEISQKLVLGWVQFRAVPEVVFSYGEFFKQRNMIKEVINKQNTTKHIIDQKQNIQQIAIPILFQYYNYGKVSLVHQVPSLTNSTRGNDQFTCHFMWFSDIL
ncbi:Hypothetical_protein [Hexamita inflata]|uniref:Hypothetical_protein n=1 Tax=Hexamita inflata TaxID=28002 RepID=A0AA86PE94_9EUKA|nr:Hypothetical protein HINF_LOCUS23981 [Hexamita inflata]